MAEIPDLKDVEELPVSFKLLTSVQHDKEGKKNNFFHIDSFQGLARAETFYKNYSKFINWTIFAKND